MLKRRFQFVVAATAMLAIVTGCELATGDDSSWQRDFNIASCKLLTTGSNPYFVMEPGFQLVLQDDETKLEITVLDQTKQVAGVTTRVIE